MAARATILPFYVVCDVSGSMGSDGRIEALNDVLVATCDATALHPVIADRVRLGIISFAGRAEVVLPLCDVGLLDRIPRLLPRDLTSYSAAFELSRSTIEHDAAQLVADELRVFRPTIFFMTDGRPTDAPEKWRKALASLSDPAFPHRPNIVAFGLGESEAAIVQEIGTTAAYMAADAMTAPAAISTFGSVLVESVVASGAEGHFTLPAAPAHGLNELSAESDLL